MLFVIESQRDALYGSLNSACKGMIGKVLHGMSLHQEHIYTTSIATHFMQAMVVACMQRGDGASLVISKKMLEI